MKHPTYARNICSPFIGIQAEIVKEKNCSEYVVNSMIEYVAALWFAITETTEDYSLSEFHYAYLMVFCSIVVSNL